MRVATDDEEAGICSDGDGNGAEEACEDRVEASSINCSYLAR